MLASVLFCSLLIFIRNNKVVDNALNCRCLLVKVVLVSLGALLAPKEDKAITQVHLLTIWRGSKSIPFDVIVVHIRRCLRIGSLGLVAD